MTSDRTSESQKNEETIPFPLNICCHYWKEKLDKIQQEKEALLNKLKILKKTKNQAKQLVNLYNITQEQLKKSQENERVLQTYIQSQQWTTVSTAKPEEINSLNSEISSLKMQLERMRILTRIQQERITNFESEISKLRENLRDYESQINAKEILIAQLKSELRKSKQLNEDLESSLIRLQKEMEELKFQLELEKQKHLTISTELNRYSEVMSPPLSTSTTSKFDSSPSQSSPSLKTKKRKKSSNKAKKEEINLLEFEQQLMNELEEGEIPQAQQPNKKRELSSENKENSSQEVNTSKSPSDQMIVFELDIEDDQHTPTQKTQQNHDHPSEQITEKASSIKFVLPREWEEEQRILRSLVDQQLQKNRRLQALQRRESEPDVHYMVRLFRLVMDRKIDEEEIVDDVVTLLESTLSPRNIARGFRLFLSEVSRSLPTINTSNVDNKKILSFALKGTVWEWDIILILWNLSKRIEFSMEILTKKLRNYLINQKPTVHESVLIVRFISLICRVMENKTELANLCSELFRFTDSPFIKQLLFLAVYGAWPQLFLIHTHNNN